MAAEKATLVEQVRKRFFKAEKVVLLFRNKVHCKLQWECQHENSEIGTK